MPGLVSARRWVPHRGAGSIPVHSICCNVFTSFVLFVGLELDLGLWLIFLYYSSECHKQRKSLQHVSFVDSTCLIKLRYFLTIKVIIFDRTFIFLVSSLESYLFCFMSLRGLSSFSLYKTIIRYLKSKLNWRLFKVFYDYKHKPLVVFFIDGLPDRSQDFFFPHRFKPDHVTRERTGGLIPLGVSALIQDFCTAFLF